MTWIEDLIGLPWEAGARGPDSFDCYGLVFWVYLTKLEFEISPLKDLDPKNLLAVNRTYVDESRSWKQVAKPDNFSVVAMSTNKLIHHVGIWLDIDGGTVLHAMEKSHVVAQSLMSLRSSGFQTFKFYQLP